MESLTLIFLRYLEQFWEMCSFSETVARRLATTCPEELVNYNKTWFSRVYPGGKRVGSSNYNPQEMWNCGCQMGKQTLIYFIFIFILSFVCHYSVGHERLRP
jgi:hypothetical protein